MQFKLAFIGLAFAATLHAESNRSHYSASFSPFAGRPTECQAEESASNLRIGPRAELLGDLVEQVEGEFKRVRGVTPSAMTDDVLAQDLVNNNPAVLRLILRHSLNLAEVGDLAKRWNDKYLHGAVKLPSEKTGFKTWLSKAFNELYEMPNLDDRVVRFHKAVADEQAHRNALIEQGIASGKTDLAAINESIAKSKGLVDALNQLQSSMIGRTVTAVKSVSDYLRRR